MWIIVLGTQMFFQSEKFMTLNSGYFSSIISFSTLLHFASSISGMAISQMLELLKWSRVEKEIILEKYPEFKVMNFSD